MLRNLGPPLSCFKMPWKGYSKGTRGVSFRILAPLPATWSRIFTLFFSDWLLMALESPRGGKEGDCGSLFQRWVPRGPCLLPHLVWAILHNQWKVNAAVLLRLSQKKLAVSALISWDFQLQNPTTRLGEAHATWRDHAGSQAEINGQPRDEPSWTCSAQWVFRWLQPQLPFESKGMRPPPSPSKDNRAECSQHLQQQDRTRRQISTEVKGKPEIKPDFSTYGNMVNEIEICGPIELFKFKCSYLLSLTPFP